MEAGLMPITNAILKLQLILFACAVVIDFIFGLKYRDYTSNMLTPAATILFIDLIITPFTLLAWAFGI